MSKFQSFSAWHTLVCVCSTIFLTLGCGSKGSNPTPVQPQQPTVSLPTISTTTVSAVTSSTAQSGGSISANGGGAITARGVCWGKASSPQVNPTTTTIDGTGNGTYNSVMTNLIPGASYYVRAYATNSAGTAYGNQVQFQALANPPTVSIVVASAYSNGAVIDFKTTATGGSDITAAGVCWSTTQNPTITNGKTVDGTGIKEFITTISNLTINTIYYVRAYATNNAGTAYSAQVTFTTAYAIGQNFGGGKIFYIDATKVHGFIVTAEDQSSIAQWDNTTGGNWLATGATSPTDGTGNTTKIIQTLGSGQNAAAICRACRDGGYTDWFLPAVYQLVLLSNQNSVLYPDLNTPGAFGGNEYWSSTESSTDVTSAFYMNLSGTQYANDFKNNTHSVRAIRAF